MEVGFSKGALIDSGETGSTPRTKFPSANRPIGVESRHEGLSVFHLLVPEGDHGVDARRLPSGDIGRRQSSAD
jgi:hypothetical protein